MAEYREKKIDLTRYTKEVREIERIILQLPDDKQAICELSAEGFLKYKNAQALAFQEAIRKGITTAKTETEITEEFLGNAALQELVYGKVMAFLMEEEEIKKVKEYGAEKTVREVIYMRASQYYAEQLKNYGGAMSGFQENQQGQDNS